MSRRFRLTIAALGIGLMSMLAFTGVASAGENGNYPVEEPHDVVLGNVVTPPKALPKTEAESLAKTGGDVIGLTIIGLGAVAAGFVLVRVQKRAKA